MRSMSAVDEGQEPGEGAWYGEPERSAHDADLLEEMAEARPADAPTPVDLGGARRAIEDCQMEAYAAGDEDWWRYGEGWVLHEQDAEGRWVPEAGDAGESG